MHYLYHLEELIERVGHIEHNVGWSTPLRVQPCLGVGDVPAWVISGPAELGIKGPWRMFTVRQVAWQLWQLLQGYDVSGLISRYRYQMMFPNGSSLEWAPKPLNAWRPPKRSLIPFNTIKSSSRSKEDFNAVARSTAGGLGRAHLGSVISLRTGIV